MRVSASVAAVSAALSMAVPVTEGADSPVHYPQLGVRETIETYRTVQQVELKLHIFTRIHRGQAPAPAGRTAIVLFFGGGWKSGTTAQFKPHSQYFASRGAVAITPEYRIRNVHQSTARQSVMDAMSAIRWVRKNAQRLGINPRQVVAGGGSAGGHLAAAVATLPDFQESREDSEVSCIPDGLLLFNPALDLRHEAFQLEEDSERYQDILARLGTTPEKISPILHVPEKAPPTIIFHGRDDPTVPFSQATAFQTAWSPHGICEVQGYAGQKHGFFNFNRKNSFFRQTVEAADRFLVEHGFLQGASTIKEFEVTIRAAE